MEFASISTGTPFKGKLPNVVEVLGSDKSFTRTIVHEVRPGDAEWDDALVWWMYVKGYMPESELADQLESKEKGEVTVHIYIPEQQTPPAPSVTVNIPERDV